jgi:nicotinamidase-related amidase
MDPLNVLVVVDVQNCFMYNSDDNATFLNMGSLNLDGTNTKDNTASKEIANEIAELTTKNDIVVFTRDYHPINHISFEGDEGRDPNPPQTWPRHCRNKNRVCSDRTKKGEVAQPMNVSIPGAINGETKLIDALKANFDSDTLNKMFSDENDLTWLDKNMTITGTDLSYFFYNTSIRNIISRLTQSNKLGDFKIGLASTLDETAQSQPVDSSKIVTLDDIAWENVLPMEYNNTKFVTLTKGEDCSRESYSAFNYHIEYDISTPNAPVRKENVVSIDTKNSTGLWEWILKENGGIQREIIVTVCGLVGNVCVMHTILEGKAMWDNLYQEKNPGITVKFILSINGTRFLENIAPGVSKPQTADQLVKVNEEKLGRSYINLLNMNIPRCKNGPCKFPEFMIQFPDGSETSSAGLLVMNAQREPAEAPAKGGKRTRRMRMRRTRKQHKKQCKCSSCACNKRKSRRRARRSYRRR